jgi:hypothetical protein
MRISARAVVLLLGAFLAACAGLLGLDDVRYEVPADASTEATTGEGGAADPIADAAFDANDEGSDACAPEEWVQTGGPGTVTCGSTSGVNLGNSPVHCGRCFHACEGSCTSGSCDSVPWQSLDAAPKALAADREYVYWAPDNPGLGKLYRRAVADGGVAELLGGVPDGGSEQFGQISVSDVAVFARAYGLVLVAAKDFSRLYTITVGDHGAAAAGGPGKLLVSNTTPGSVIRYQYGSPSATAIATGESNVTELVSVQGGKQIFWLRPNQAVRVYDDVNRARDLVGAPAENAMGLVGDDTAVFWMVAQQLDAGNGQLWAHSVADGNTRAVATLPELHPRYTTIIGVNPAFVALDEKYVYWAPDGDFTIRRTHRCTGDTSVVTRYTTGGDPPWGIAVSGDFVYFGTQGGIRRAAK